MLNNKTPLFYAKQALRLHYFNCTEQWKQTFPSPELLFIFTITQLMDMENNMITSKPLFQDCITALLKLHMQKYNTMGK